MPIVKGWKDFFVVILTNISNPHELVYFQFLIVDKHNNEELYFILGNGHRYISRETLISIHVVNIHQAI